MKSLDRRFRVWGFILALALGAFFLSGCALGVRRVQLSYNPLDRVEKKQPANILVETFVDERKDKEYIGNQRSAIGLVVGHIGTEEGVKLETVLTGYFADALRAAGYNATLKSEGTAGAQRYDAILTGRISEFWVDTYGAVWHNLTVKLEVMDPVDRRILWSRDVKGEEKRFLRIGTTEEFKRIIREATTNALNDAAKAFASDEFAATIHRGGGSRR